MSWSSSDDDEELVSNILPFYETHPWFKTKGETFIKELDEMFVTRGCNTVNFFFRFNYLSNKSVIFNVRLSKLSKALESIKPSNDSI